MAVLSSSRRATIATGDAGAAGILAPWVRWARLAQRWGMFTPSPPTFATRDRVEIAFTNGRQVAWSRPLAPAWDFFARHEAYNYEKWFFRSGDESNLENFWPDLAVYLGNRFGDQDNVPRRLELIRAQAPTPPPRSQGDLRPEPADYHFVERSLGVRYWDPRDAAGSSP